MERLSINPVGLAKPGGYSHCITVQDAKLIFIAGQVGWNEDRKFANGSDLRAQAEGAYRNLGIALSAGGATYTDIVKMTTYVVGFDATMWPVLGEVFTRYFPEENRPATVLVGVSALAFPELLIEIEAIAAVPLT